MWPEVWLRRFVTSPVTQISPTCFSSRRLICHVSSVTVSTLRICSNGNSSPKSHCDLTGLAIVQLKSFAISHFPSAILGCSSAALWTPCPTADLTAQQYQQPPTRSEEHTSELQSLRHLVCRLLLE